MSIPTNFTTPLSVIRFAVIGLDSPCVSSGINQTTSTTLPSAAIR